MRKIPLVHFIEWKKLDEKETLALFSELPAWGIKEIVAHPVWGKNEEAEKGYLEKIARLLEKNALSAPGCHAFWGGTWDLATATAKEIASHIAFLEKLSSLMGVKTYTIHLGLHEGNKASFRDDVRRNTEKLLPAAETAKIVLSLENSAEDFATFEWLAEYETELASPWVGVCFDTGHANCYTPPWERLLDLLRPFVTTCHMHDNYGAHDDHNPPGGGNLDWKKLVAALKSCPRLFHAETESGDWDRLSFEKFRAVWEK